MNPIPPHERFNHHEQKRFISDHLIERALHRFDPTFKLQSFKSLSGGFMNSNFLIQSQEQKLVLRFYSGINDAAERERDVLLFLKNKEIKVPNHLGLLKIENSSVAVLEYIDGINFETKLLHNDLTSSEIYFEIGAELAKIHSITFPHQGFIKKEMEIGDEYKNFSLFLKDFIFKTMETLKERPERLDRETLLRLQKLIEMKWELVENTTHSHQLVHTDFNPKNIIVTDSKRPKLLSIIDWEFVLSGNGLLDLGNFFRFSDDYDASGKKRFEEGYRSITPDLPPNWEEVSKLLDLANMCSFLECKEDYQKSFRTAKSVILSTLDYFNS